MNLQNRLPIFVPREHWGEIEKLSKATLMDMVWDFAAQSVGTEPHICIELIMDEVRQRAEIILNYRNQEYGEQKVRIKGTGAAMTFIAILIALTTANPPTTFAERWPYEWEQFTPVRQHVDPIPTMHASGKGNIFGRCAAFGRTICIWDMARI